MQFCMPHWKQLRSAIQRKGMFHLVARSGEEATTRTAAELKGEHAPFDPLMSCHWQITNRALELGGLYLMSQKPDGGSYCPLCEVEANIKVTDEAKAECKCEGGFKDIPTCWIEGCTDSAVEYCKEQGLELKTYESLKIYYLCGLCDLPEIEVEVPAREADEDIKAWVNRAASYCVSDHKEKRPKCEPKEFKHLKIPLPKDEGRNIGSV